VSIPLGRRDRRICRELEQDVLQLWAIGALGALAAAAFVLLLVAIVRLFV